MLYTIIKFNGRTFEKTFEIEIYVTVLVSSMLNKWLTFDMFPSGMESSSGIFEWFVFNWIKIIDLVWIYIFYILISI